MKLTLFLLSLLLSACAKQAPVPVTKLTTDYKTDSQRADSLYKKKRIIILGEPSTNTDTSLVFQTPALVVCRMREPTAAIKTPKNVTTTLECTCEGSTEQGIYLTDCVIAK